MSLRGALGPGERMSKAEREREPRHLGVIAWFDGHAQAQNGGRPWQAFPRRLDHAEAASWREGFAEGTREKRCHDHHGFTPCPTPDQQPHPPRKERP